MSQDEYTITWKLTTGLLTHSIAEDVKSSLDYRGYKFTANTYGGLFNKTHIIKIWGTKAQLETLREWAKRTFNA